ncbi:hypothetical protein L6164_017445 [Bauhinia variegata]|nr:hypothetical protein L6164_017445 [Bauhinia variegata]
MQRYEIGHLLGQGNFAKVYLARNLRTNQPVAIKVINKEKVLEIGMTDQIKREISTMRLVKHPNIVQLYEVMASKTKVYFAMEYVKGGELFDKISQGKRLSENVARKYFQQLIGAVDFCHSRGVYHRDLKPENLLVNENGDLKVSDFGLSALKESTRNDGLLHTTCGTPAYVAPEVITQKGYDGAKADTWSCGVILFVLLAGYLPFHERNLIRLYRKICIADFRCPPSFPDEVKKLLSRILHPKPKARINTADIMETTWFKKGYMQFQAPMLPPQLPADCEVSDVEAAFASSNSDDSSVVPNNGGSPMRPSCFNAFDIISLSSGFDLSGLFEEDKSQRQEIRFTTQKPASMIVSKLEEVAKTESKFKVVKKNGTVSLQGSKVGRKGQLGIDAQIFQVTSSLHIVEVKKSSGDTLEYRQFWDQDLKPSLQEIVWTWQGCEQQQQK